MARWFRFYDEVLNDPKVQRLDGETFKAWVNLLCLASQNGGKLPAISDIAFALRETEDAALTLVERLLNGGLIDKVSGGASGYAYAPHGWVKRQYKSDTSTDRVKRFRERSKSVTVTPPETETETETEKDNPPPPNGSGARVYAFSGQVAKLNRRDYDEFRRRFHAIPDFDAALTALDSWLTTQTEAKQAKWFGSCAPWLEKRHQEAITAQKARAGPVPVIGI